MDDALSRAQELLRHSLAENTRRAYAADWRHFSSWCQANHRIPLPALPETVALYLTGLSEEYKASTLTRRISAISQAHQAAGFDSPTQAPVVRQLMKGIRRTLGTAQTGKSPVKVEHLRTIMGLAQQRYVKSHRILANRRGVKDFRRFRNSQAGTRFSRSVLGA